MNGEEVIDEFRSNIDDIGHRVSSASKSITSGDVFRDIRFMHAYYGFDNIEFTRHQLYERIKFLREELGEIFDAYMTDDAEGVVDGLIDLVVVAVGTLDRAEVKPWRAWNAVHVANMKKEVGLNPSRPNSNGIDLVKPEGWEPPSHVGNHGVLDDILREENHVDYDKPENDIQSSKKVKDRHAVDVLQECIEIMRKKSADYQSPHSTITAADYYPHGIDDIMYEIDTKKRFRTISILDAIRAGVEPNTDTLEDSFMDRINYLAIAIEYIRGEMDGSNPKADIFNRYKQEGI